MSDVVYLYGRGSRKHIAMPEQPSERARTYCGRWHWTEDAIAAIYRHWDTPQGANRYVAQMKALPVCQHCAKAAER